MYRRIVTSLSLAFVLFVSGCTPDAKAIVQDVLTVAQIACLLGPAVDPQMPDAAMEICGIEQKLAPLVQQLLAQKAAAQKAASCEAGAKKK